MYLGALVDDAGPLLYDGNQFTTHGVIVGMTGTGKTGLGFNLIEESLINSVPTLVIDPKGDMGNLLLSFPGFAPADFKPWIDSNEAQQKGLTDDQMAEKEATKLRKRMTAEGITEERMRRLAENTEMTIYTPGSSAGVSLNVLGTLRAPEMDWEKDSELIRDEIESYVSSLLVLAKIDSDPVSSPDHILISTIIETFWRKRQDLDLATLIGLIPKPPFRKLGVFDLDVFFPEKERTKLAMGLNAVLASPSFSSWIVGRPLDIETMLTGEKTRAAIIYLAHLTEEQRQFAVTLLLSKLVTWFRAQTGSEGLRVLVYMDEAFGYAPPTAEPPSKKPILTILKQARAFGVGMVLATQNPVDLDYKALSNAGTWFIGRLQTENDKRRMLEGLSSSQGDLDAAGYSQLISGLKKRQFVLHTTKDKPRVFKARRAMSFRAGPFTRDQVSLLMKDRTDALPTDTETSPRAAHEPPGSIDSGLVPVAPAAPEGMTTSFLDPGAPWAEQVNADPAGSHYEPAIAITVGLLYDDAPAKVSHMEKYEAVIYPIGEPFDPSTMQTVDHDPRDFLVEPTLAEANYSLSEARLHTKAFWTSVESAVKSHLVASRKIAIYKNPSLKLYARVGETENEFTLRCRAAAVAEADTAMAKLNQRYQTRIDRVKASISKADSRVRDLEATAAAKGQAELLAGAGDLLGALIGGRRGSNPLGQAAKRRSATAQARARVEQAEIDLAEEQAELVELEDDLAREMAKLSDEMDGKAEDVALVEIPLEKTDVSLADIRLVWIPRSDQVG